MYTVYGFYTKYKSIYIQIIKLCLKKDSSLSLSECCLSKKREGEEQWFAFKSKYYIIKEDWDCLQRVFQVLRRKFDQLEFCDDVVFKFKDISLTGNFIADRRNCMTKAQAHPLSLDCSQVSILCIQCIILYYNMHQNIGGR